MFKKPDYLISLATASWPYRDWETGKWVILNYFPHEPADVFGFFDTEKEALEYAIKHKMDMYGNSFDIQMVLNAHYEEPRREPWE